MTTVRPLTTPPFVLGTCRESVRKTPRKASVSTEEYDQSEDLLSPPSMVSQQKWTRNAPRTVKKAKTDGLLVSPPLGEPITPKSPAMFFIGPGSFVEKDLKTQGQDWSLKCENQMQLLESSGNLVRRMSDMGLREIVKEDISTSDDFAFLTPHHLKKRSPRNPMLSFSSGASRFVPQVMNDSISSDYVSPNTPRLARNILADSCVSSNPIFKRLSPCNFDSTVKIKNKPAEVGSVTSISSNENMCIENRKQIGPNREIFVKGSVFFAPSSLETRAKKEADNCNSVNVHRRFSANESPKSTAFASPKLSFKMPILPIMESVPNRFPIAPSPSIASKRPSLGNLSFGSPPAGNHASVSNRIPRMHAIKNLSAISPPSSEVIYGTNDQTQTSSSLQGATAFNTFAIPRQPSTAPCGPLFAAFGDDTNKGKSMMFRAADIRVQPATVVEKVEIPSTNFESDCTNCSTPVTAPIPPPFNFFSPPSNKQMPFAFLSQTNRADNVGMPASPMHVSPSRTAKKAAIQPTPDQSVFDSVRIRKQRLMAVPSTPARPQLVRRSSLLDTKLLYSAKKMTEKLDGLGFFGSVLLPQTVSPKSNQSITFASPSIATANSFSLEHEFFDISKIGEGSFFEVFQAKCKRTRNLFAIKRSKNAFRSKNDRSKYMSEVNSLVSAGSNNPHIVEMFNCWQEDAHFFIQLEYCMCTLTEHVKRLPVIQETFARRVLHEVALGLRQIHSHDLVHMDLKPDNILLGLDHNFKIGDFGSAVLKSNAVVDTSESDCVYIAPELFEVFLI